MPRRNFSIIVSNNADQLIALARRILQKYQQDGSVSTIPPTLLEQLQNKLDTAQTEHARLQELNRRREKLTEERNLLLGLHNSQNTFTEGTPLYAVTASRDILLGQYRGNERQLGDWGYTVNSPKGKVQVVIPRTADELINLTKSVMQKHYNDGNSSLLNSLSWDGVSNKLYEAEMKLEEARQINRDKEKATQARNIALGIDHGQSSKTPNTVKYIVRVVRDVLLGVYRGKEQILGDWGFEVNQKTANTSVTNEVAE